MDTIAQYALFGILAIIFAILLYNVTLGAWSPRAKRAIKNPPKKGSRLCPLCSSILISGDQVKSAVFPGSQGRLTHVFGCPACYPANDRAPRICPACKKVVPMEGYVVGRLFDRPKGKHLHILGCTACRKL